MKDLLNEKCGLVLSEDEVRKLSRKYRIPFQHVSRLAYYNTWIITNEGIHPVSSRILMQMNCDNKPIFNKMGIENYLFERALREGRLIIKKTSYKAYLEMISLLPLLGITCIKDEDYFNRAFAFYVSNDELKPINEFGVKNVISMCKGISMKTDEFLEDLKLLINNKNHPMLRLANRKREWIHKFTYNGAPISWANTFFRSKLMVMRMEHPEFDLFLKEIGELLTKENNDGFKNIIRLINNDADTNWISTNDSILDALIKLFNYCLSSEQAVDYIKTCYEFYLKVINEEYEMHVQPEFSICLDRWDGKHREAVEFDWVIKDKFTPRFYNYWFRFKTSLKIVEEYINDISCQCTTCKIVSNQELPNDAFMLFVYHQNKPFLRDLFNKGIEELLERRLIKKINESDFYDWKIHDYQMTDEIVKEKK